LMKALMTALLSLVEDTEVEEVVETEAEEVVETEEEEGAVTEEEEEPPRNT